MWKKHIVSMIGVTVAFLGNVPGSFAQSEECLVQFHAADAAVPDRGTLCQTATERACVFDLQLCLNQPEVGCTPANFQAKKFAATGHCGPVRQLRVEPSGTQAVCGAVTGVKVRTKANGKRPGRCTIRAEVRSAKRAARTDVDTITLMCMPAGGQCPSTTTTTLP